MSTAPCFISPLGVGSKRTRSALNKMYRRKMMMFSEADQPMPLTNLPKITGLILRNINFTHLWIFAGPMEIIHLIDRMTVRTNMIL